MFIIVQTRMSSTWLLKKVLGEINGKPLLEYLVARLIGIIESDICIATSGHSENDEIEDFCREIDIPCFRGSRDNIAKRMLDAAKHYNKDVFVQINVDSPLIDYKIIDQAIRIFQNGEYDLVTNTFLRSFPVGQSVEVIQNYYESRD